MSSELRTRIVEVQPEDHLILLSGDERQQVDASAEFLAEGVRQGDRWASR